MFTRKRAKSADASARSASRACPTCARPLDDDAAFCPKCGANVSRKPDEKPDGSRRRKKKVKKEVSRLLGERAALATNDLVGFERMYETGIAETALGTFCRTLAFGETSYEDERADVKNMVYDRFAELHRYFAPNTRYQINLVNFPIQHKDVKRYLSEEGADAELARAYNDIFAARHREGRTDFERVNYLTFSVQASDLDEAEKRLAAMRDSVAKHFARLKIETHALDGMGRMRLHHRLLRGEVAPFVFDYERLERSRARARDFVAPTWAAYGPGDLWLKSELFMPGRVVKTYWIRDVGSDLSDRAIRTIRALPIPLNISLLFSPQAKSKMVREIRTNINVAQAEIFDYQRQVARAGGDITLIPPAIENRETESRELLDFIQEQDQMINYFQGLVTVFAEDETKMQAYHDMLMAEAQTWTIDLAELPLVQEQALTSALPLATTRLPTRFRSLTTDECAVMIPFSSQRAKGDPKKSLMLGQDTVSQGDIFVDPDRLKSPHMWIFGMTGAGKGMLLNAILTFMMLQYPRAMGAKESADPTAPQVFSFDFHGEYTLLNAKVGGVNVPLGPSHPTCLNPLDMANEAGVVTNKLLQTTTDFFLALCSNVMGRELDQAEKSMLDRCLRAAFEPHIGQSTRPTLDDLYRALREQGQEVATHLAESWEMFVKGSMNAFNGKTNCKESRRWTNFDCSELGSTMQTFAMLSAMQYVKQCAYRNFREGRMTYLVLEEAQVLFDNDAAVRVLDSFFSEMRKYGLRIICVTQLPGRVLEHPRARYLFDNTGLFVFLAQLEDNADLIARKFRLSETQKDCMREGAKPGSGLVIADGLKIAMQNDIPKTSPLYEIWNTDPDKLAKKAG